MHTQTPTDHGNASNGRRERLGWWLTALMFFIYFGFLLLGASLPALFAEPLRAGGTVNIASAALLSVVGLAVALTGYYVWRVNNFCVAIGLILSGSLALLPFEAAAQATARDETAFANTTAIVLFGLTILCTLAVTYWAARRTRSTHDFYAAGGNITGLQNGFAIAGDYMSAAAFLGVTALIYVTGFDGIVFALGFVVGWPIMVFLVAERLRNLGRYTFADVIASRLSGKPTRVLAACATLTIVAFYLVAQMVGAGQLIRLLFGLDYIWAVILVGTLMIFYVVFGGMTATTWVQIIKAVLLLTGTAYLAFMVLREFGFDMGTLMSKAASVHKRGEAILAPQALQRDPISAFSLGLGLMLGTVGLPHILMRFFTVKDADAARQSVFWATLLIASFFLMVIVMGYGAIVLVGTNPAYMDAKGALIGGGNTVAIHLAHAVGGVVLVGVVSAVAFATILAVVAGLALAGASAISHDLYANVFRRGVANDRLEMAISKMATVAIGVSAILLGLAFETQNVAYMVGLAFAIAASVNFPVLILAMYWRGLTTRGAVAGGAVGLVGSVALTVLGPAIWVKVLGNATPVFAYDPPTIVTMPMAFFVCYLVSTLDRSAQGADDRESFRRIERDASSSSLAAAVAK